MPRTESISIFNATNIAKNASTTSGLVSLRKFGPSSRFWGDITASNPGRVSIRYQIAMSPDDTFYTPSNASFCCASFLGGTNASRDCFPLSIIGTPWAKFKAKEQNASHVKLTFNLIVAKE